jgi:geranylgeranyl pyrophosphate synthase
LIPATDQAAEVSSWQRHFEEVLDRRLPAENSEPKLLHQAMRYSALAGGKRFRPVLVYATGKTLGLQLSQLDALACAVEAIHAYSLIHDDLPSMDDDDLRRGRPTCHRAYDEATAILAGDALQALAFELLSEENSNDARLGLKMLRNVAIACGSTGMAGGQVLDLNATGKKLSLAELENMHRLKTGALISACVTTPGILARVNGEQRHHLSAYGDCTGLAFQIHDDVLDVTGDSEQTGKSSHADAALNKPTFPSIIGLDASRQRAEELRDQANRHLEAIQGDTSALAWLADYVINRDR